MMIFLSLALLFTNRNIYARELTSMHFTTYMESMNESKSEIQDEIIIKTNDVLIGEFVLTAYCPCSVCCGSYSNPSNPKTASGNIAQSNHTIAADINVLPFGTEVIIDGQTYTVEDVGGGVNGNHIDIYFNTHSEALYFGRKIEKVYKQEEVTIVLKPVEFREYMVITGNLMEKKIATSYYDKSTGNTIWKNKNDEIVATRKKNENGGYENRVEESVYTEWLRSR